MSHGSDLFCNYSLTPLYFILNGKKKYTLTCLLIKHKRSRKTFLSYITILLLFGNTFRQNHAA